MNPLWSPLESVKCTLRTNTPGDARHSEEVSSFPSGQRRSWPGRTQKHELPKPVLLGIFLNIHPFYTFTDLFYDWYNSHAIKFMLVYNSLFFKIFTEVYTIAIYLQNMFVTPKRSPSPSTHPAPPPRAFGTHVLLAVCKDLPALDIP